MDINQQQYYHNVIATLGNIFNNQVAQIDAAAEIFAKCVESNGFIYGFGSGHSFAGAIELAGRAGGLINTKAIDQFYGLMGWYDGLSGSGDLFASLLNIKSNDCFVILSNSGNKPLHVELAKKIKEKGAKVIVITSLLSARQSNDKANIIDYADVILDNFSPIGDCTISIANDDFFTGPTSSISNAFIINNIVIKSISILLSRGITPPIMHSINKPGGKDYNENLISKFRDQIFGL